MNNLLPFSSLIVWYLMIFLEFNYFCVDLVKSQKFDENVLNLTITTQTDNNDKNQMNDLPSLADSIKVPVNQQNLQLPSMNNNNNRFNVSIRQNPANCEEGYDCVPYFLCKDNVIVKDGSGIINIRIGDDEGCTDSMELCCAINNLTVTPIINTTPPKSPERCGYRNTNGIVVRITGDDDNETQFAEFPWMIAVLRKERKLNGDELIIFQCGGSLINSLVVLTAAHCVSGLISNNLKIRAGEWDTVSVLEPLPYQDRDVLQVIIHENYNHKSLKNDIALLFLSSPLDTTVENVKPICLPSSDLKLTDYEKCYATGWGKDKFGAEGKNQVILKKIDLPIVSHDKCQNALRTTRLSNYFELHESFLCAGGIEGKDTCTGDGGSPLVCEIYGTKNRYHQVGIVSWGIGCGDNNIPGVYTNVPNYRHWIDQMITSKNLDGISYTP